jgi:hypothetical protein
MLRGFTISGFGLVLTDRDGYGSDQLDSSIKPLASQRFLKMKRRANSRPWLDHSPLAIAPQEGRAVASCSLAQFGGACP